MDEDGQGNNSYNSNGDGSNSTAIDNNTITNDNDSHNTNNDDHKNQFYNFTSMEDFLAFKAAHVDHLFAQWYREVEEGPLREGVEALAAARNAFGGKGRYEGNLW